MGKITKDLLEKTSGGKIEEMDFIEEHGIRIMRDWDPEKKDAPKFWLEKDGKKISEKTEDTCELQKKLEDIYNS